MVKVEQLVNKNQFTIRVKNKIYFQSYESLIACYDFDKKQLTLYPDWDYSNTTRKHLYIFIDNYVKYEINRRLYGVKSKRKEIVKMIKGKIIKYAREEK